ncbi:ABC transporter substrate-binding protein [Roseomonas gilardii]|uniref:ABC transporter substrate-binding protein n=1 Tax=Roseomonas gilardii TaxID=257708 RepID=UPI0011AA7C5F|nr:ABC transporter substrate-binding protein [Roseomonas gilardii]
MNERIARLLERLAAEPPHVAEFTRRRFIGRAASFGLTAAAASALTQGFTPQALAQGVTLPEIRSIPEKLKGSGVVRVCSYGGSLQEAQRRAYFKPFEELSGIRVVETEGPDIAKVKAMVDTGNIEYDVTEQEGASVAALAAKGDYWEKIDYELFDTANIDPVFRKELFVDMLPYAQIYAYRTDAFKAAKPATVADLWDVKKFPGPRALMGGGSLNPDLELGALAAGVPRDKVYPIDIDKAIAKLGELKPHVVKWWGAGAQPAQLLNDDEVVMATAWNGRIATIQASGAPVEIVWQDQLLRNDCWAIPKGAPNRENAQKFAAFITLAAPQARLSSLITYGFVNNKAAELLPADRLKLLPTAPDIKGKLINYDSAWWAANLDAVKARWNRFLLG